MLGNTTSPEGYYTIGIDLTLTDTVYKTSFLATAVPVADGPQASDSCETFAIDQDGPDHTSPYADASCWRR